MKTKAFLILVFCLILASSAAYANATISLRVGHPEGGVYTDLSVDFNVNNFILLADALEANVNEKTARHTYIGGDLGYSLGKITPFVSISNVKAERFEIVEDGGNKVQKLLSEDSDTCFGVGVSGKCDLSKVVVDASCRAFKFQDKVNTILKADVKYRIGDNSFLSVGYTRWDAEKDNLFGGFGFGLQMGF